MNSMSKERRQAVFDYLHAHYTYDAHSGLLVNKRTGRAVRGAVHTRGYKSFYFRMNGRVIKIFYHRAVWAWFHGCWPTEIDHVNGVKTDNRIENLREASSTTNSYNRLYAWHPNNDTGLPGVCDDKGSYKTTVRGAYFYGQDKYQVFILGIMLGKMYQYGRD